MDVLETQYDFDYLLVRARDDLIVIMFTAAWCAPCREIKPIAEKVAKENPRVHFAIVDVEKLGDLAEDCGVASLPTFQFWRRKRQIDEAVSPKEARLRSLVERLSQKI